MAILLGQNPGLGIFNGHKWSQLYHLWIIIQFAFNQKHNTYIADLFKTISANHLLWAHEKPVQRFMEDCLKDIHFNFTL